MRPLVPILGILAILALVPPPATAQQSSMLVVTLEVPEVVTEGSVTTFTGTVTYTADLTGLIALHGIPVTYTVTAQPAWASVFVSPASDVFPTPPPGAYTGASYTVSRHVTITVAASSHPTDVTDAIEIHAVTTPTQLGHAAEGKGAVPVTYDAGEAPCEEHALDADLAALAAKAADEWNAQQAATKQADPISSDDELSVQNTGARTLSLPWIATAGFAVVGAGIGLVLRRRFSG